MESSILTISWPEDVDMQNFHRFETAARTGRYQALGRACRDRKIQALMLAHHGDDQAETVMMRLANNRLRTGLKGMQPVEWIPARWHPDPATAAGYGKGKTDCNL
jgi:tRNA(Ile)-lysidine synthase TilS/MesJ